MTKLTNLNTLTLPYSKSAAKDLQLLTNLTDLTVQSEISDEGVKHLTNLVSLSLPSASEITGKAFKDLSFLTHLKISSLVQVSHDSFRTLTNLISLDSQRKLSRMEEYRKLIQFLPKIKDS